MSRRRPTTAVSATKRPSSAAVAEKPRRGSRPSTPRRSSTAASSTGRRDRPRRRLGRAVFVAALSVLALASAGAGGRWLLEQPLFRVQHVTVVGLHHESRNQVLAASGLESHPSMLSVSSRSLRQRLERFAWIDRVAVHKHWPNSIVIDVGETHPVAVAFARGHVLRYVDARGRDLGPAPLHANLPTLLYVGPAHGVWPYSGVARGSAEVASQLPPAFSAQVSVITENSRGSVRLEMTTPVTFILGPPSNLQAKFVAVASVIAHSTLAPGDVVDVTVPDELSVSGAPPSP